MYYVSGFHPLPKDAVTSAQPDEYRALVSLFTLAHRLRFRPIRITERRMVDEWSLSNRRCWQLLEHLESLGLLRVEKGDRRRPTVIHVYDCTARTKADNDEEVRHSDQQGDQQGDQQNAAGETHDTGESAAQGEAQGEAQGAAHSRDLRPIPEPEPEEPPNPHGGAEPWARTVKRPKGVTALALQGAVVRCLTALFARPVNPATSKTAAKPVLALWSARGHQNLEEFVGEVELVANWAQRSPDGLAREDIRWEHKPGKPDRSRSPKTLCVQDRFDERLLAAQQWHSRGRPTQAPRARGSPNGFHLPQEGAKAAPQPSRQELIAMVEEIAELDPRLAQQKAHELGINWSPP